MSVCITDIVDDGKELELTEKGMLRYKGTNIFSGYLGNSRENENIFRDGWFKSGDMGWVEPMALLHWAGASRASPKWAEKWCRMKAWSELSRKHS